MRRRFNLPTLAAVVVFWIAKPLHAVEVDFVLSVFQIDLGSAGAGEFQDQGAVISSAGGMPLAAVGARRGPARPTVAVARVTATAEGLSKMTVGTEIDMLRLVVRTVAKIPDQMTALKITVPIIVACVVGGSRRFA